MKGAIQMVAKVIIRCIGVMLGLVLLPIGVIYAAATIALLEVLLPLFDWFCDITLDERRDLERCKEDVRRKRIF